MEYSGFYLAQSVLWGDLPGPGCVVGFFFFFSSSNGTHAVIWKDVTAQNVKIITNIFINAFQFNMRSYVDGVDV